MQYIFIDSWKYLPSIKKSLYFNPFSSVIIYKQIEKNACSCLGNRSVILYSNEMLIYFSKFPYFRNMQFELMPNVLFVFPFYE